MIPPVHLPLALTLAAAGKKSLREVLVEIPGLQVLAGIGAGVAVAFALYYAVRSGGTDEEGNRKPFPFGPMAVSLGIAFALVGFVVLNDNFAGKTIPIYAYGFMVMVGFAVAIFVSTYRAEAVGLDGNIILDLGLWCMISGIIGARLFHYIQFSEHYEGKSLLTFFEVWKGGLVFYGGMIGSTVVGSYYLYRRGINPIRVLDVVAPAIAIGLAFARFGCFLNGCCYGGPCDVDYALAMEFPTATGSEFLHPSQLYSSLNGFIIFVLVALYGRMTFRRRVHGEVILVFMMLYAIGRFILEIFRADTDPVFGTGMKIGQVVSILLFAGTVPFYLWTQIRKHKGLAGPARPPQEAHAEDKTEKEGAST